NEFKVEICYNRHTDAYKASFYPNVKLKNNNTIEFTCNNYFEALRMKLFLI
ncbi:MAG TPA: amino acid amidase, partial [Clostridium sp.]|nr:amino acid amidase [Clostridium sp.]